VLIFRPKVASSEGMLGSAPSKSSWCGWLRPFGASKATSRMSSRQSSLRSGFPAQLTDNLQPKRINRSEFPAGQSLRNCFLGLILALQGMTSGVNARRCSLHGFLLWFAGPFGTSEGNLRNEPPARHPHDCVSCAAGC